MGPTFVELRPNRRLLDTNFEGYKLNLDSLAHWNIQLKSPVEKRSPDDVQYSFLHAKLFALHNHLIADPWDFKNVYYTDVDRKIHQIKFDKESHTFEDIEMFVIPQAQTKPGIFNISLKFASNEYLVISDGSGHLHIVKTSSRKTSQPCWALQHSDLVLGSEKYFTLIDSRVESKNEKVLLHILILSIEQNDKQFDSVLSWVTYEQISNTWAQVYLRQMQGKGAVHYAAIENTFSAVYVASDNLFKFTTDTLNSIQPPSRPMAVPIQYHWLQTTDDITITLKLPPKHDKKQVTVLVTPLTIKISYMSFNLLDGKLQHKVDSELTTWNVQEEGQLDVLLTKSESLIWDHLIEGGDPTGEQILDASVVEEAHRRLQHLCSEFEPSVEQSVPGFSTQDLEECDAASEEDTMLVRMDASTHEATHRTSLSVHQYLFSLSMSAKEVPALALRHDVDCCIWQPLAQLEDKWPIQHEGTLPAFGYIQSSKTNKKFVTCAPNFSYSVVCESTKHVFIYRPTSSAACQLRQRNGGTTRNVTFGHQYVFNIDKYKEVLGIYASNTHLYLLTEKDFVVMEIISAT